MRPGAGGPTTADVMAARGEWVEVGSIGVDAGCILVVDPCYVLPRASDGTAGLDYEHATGLDLPVFPDEPVRELPDVPGGGLLVSTGYGDGLYPVYATYRDGRVMGLFVDFGL